MILYLGHMLAWLCLKAMKLKPAGASQIIGLPPYCALSLMVFVPIPYANAMHDKKRTLLISRLIIIIGMIPILPLGDALTATKVKLGQELGWNRRYIFFLPLPVYPSHSSPIA